MYRHVYSHNILSCILLIHSPGGSSPLQDASLQAGPAGYGDHMPQVIILAQLKQELVKAQWGTWALAPLTLLTKLTIWH